MQSSNNSITNITLTPIIDLSSTRHQAQYRPSGRPYERDEVGALDLLRDEKYVISFENAGTVGAHPYVDRPRGVSGNSAYSLVNAIGHNSHTNSANKQPQNPLAHSKQKTQHTQSFGTDQTSNPYGYSFKRLADNKTKMESQQKYLDVPGRKHNDNINKINAIAELPELQHTHSRANINNNQKFYHTSRSTGKFGQYNSRTYQAKHPDPPNIQTPRNKTPSHYTNPSTSMPPKYQQSPKSYSPKIQYQPILRTSQYHAHNTSTRTKLEEMQVPFHTSQVVADEYGYTSPAQALMHVIKEREMLRDIDRERYNIKQQQRERERLKMKQEIREKYKQRQQQKYRQRLEKSSLQVSEKMRKPQSQPRQQRVSPSAYIINKPLTAVQLQIQNLKKSTIYRNTQQQIRMHGRLGYTKQQIYFGLFAARSRCKNLQNSQCISNIQAPQPQPEHNRTSMHSQSQPQQLNYKQLLKKQHINHLTLQKHYNQLYEYLKTVQAENRKIKEENVELRESKVGLQRQLARSQQQITILARERNTIMIKYDEEKKSKANLMNMQSNKNGDLNPSDHQNNINSADYNHFMSVVEYNIVNNKNSNAENNINLVGNRTIKQKADQLQISPISSPKNPNDQPNTQHPNRSYIDNIKLNSQQILHSLTQLSQTINMSRNNINNNRFSSNNNQVNNSHSHNTSIDVYELLNKAKDEIQLRDTIIADLEAKLAYISRTVTGTNDTNNRIHAMEVEVFSRMNRNRQDEDVGHVQLPLSVDFDDTKKQPNPPHIVSPSPSASNPAPMKDSQLPQILLHNNLISLSQAQTLHKKQLSLMQTRLSILQNEFNAVIDTVKFMSQRYKEQEYKLMEKEVQIEMEILHARECLLRVRNRYRRCEGCKAMYMGQEGDDGLLELDQFVFGRVLDGYAVDGSRIVPNYYNYWDEPDMIQDNEQNIEHIYNGYHTTHEMNKNGQYVGNDKVNAKKDKVISSTYSNHNNSAGMSYNTNGIGSSSNNKLTTNSYNNLKFTSNKNKNVTNNVQMKSHLYQFIPISNNNTQNSAFNKNQYSNNNNTIVDKNIPNINKTEAYSSLTNTYFISTSINHANNNSTTHNNTNIKTNNSNSNNNNNVNTDNNPYISDNQSIRSPLSNTLMLTLSSNVGQVPKVKINDQKQASAQQMRPVTQINKMETISSYTFGKEFTNKLKSPTSKDSNIPGSYQKKEYGPAIVPTLTVTPQPISNSTTTKIVKTRSQN